MPKKGFKHTEESKRLMRESHIGQVAWNKNLTKETDERVRKISEALKDKPLLEETKRKLSESGIRYFQDHPEARKNLSEKNKGKKLSEERIRKLRLGIKKLWKDPEYREMMLKLHKGKILSEETKRKISSSNKGRICSLETIRKISETKKSKVYTLEEKENLSKIHKEIWERLGYREMMKELHKGIQAGEKHPNWQDGKSFEPYGLDFNKLFKERIRERDNHCCVVCNKSEEELKRQLTAHHIDYNKLNSFPQNCVSLCTSCHTKTNFNRTSWKTFFQSLLKERHNYKYTQDQKIILDF